MVDKGENRPKKKRKKTYFVLFYPITLHYCTDHQDINLEIDIERPRMRYWNLPALRLRYIISGMILPTLSLKDKSDKRVSEVALNLRARVWSPSLEAHRFSNSFWLGSGAVSAQLRCFHVVSFWGRLSQTLSCYRTLTSEKKLFSNVHIPAVTLRWS